MIHTGDCLEVMAQMPEASVDAVVTDPPYALNFMGREWDRFAGYVVRNGSSRAVGDDGGRHDEGYRNMQRRMPEFQAWNGRWATEALRVAKPGAYLLAFGGTRTYHRLACAIEDAGWIIRDCLVWAYASGFPKSKALLKPAWEPIVMARKPGPLRELAVDRCRIPTDETLRPAGPNGGRTGPAWRGMEGREPTRQGEPSAERRYTDNGGTDIAALPGPRGGDPAGRWPANVILTDPIFDGGVDGVVGGGEVKAGIAVNRNRPEEPALTFEPTSYGIAQGRGPDVGYGDTGTYSRFFLIPKADRAEREPLDPTDALRLHRESGDCDKLRSWVSADLDRSDPTGNTSPERATSEATHPATPTDSSSDTSSPGSEPTAPSLTGTRSTTSTATRPTTGSPTSSSSIQSPTSGSTPAADSSTASGGSPAESADSSSLWVPPTGISAERDGRSTVGAARVTSRSSSSRNVCGRCGKPLPRVTTHPTVKPLDLMRHLVRLVTPPGGTILDPFLGSGTTAIAAEMEGFGWIGIEREAEYVAIAAARLQGVQRGLGLTG